MDGFMNEFMDGFMSAFGSEDAAAAGFLLVYYIFIYAFSGIFAIINYIFQGISLHTVAKRRGIEKPWLAWVPVGNMWMLGCISDQYRYVAKGQVKNRRKTLLTLDIVTLVLCFLTFVLCGISLANSFTLIANDVIGDSQVAISMGVLVLMLILCYGMVAVAIVLSVHQYIALFDYFRSCEPRLALLYFLLSLFIGFPLPFFLYVCRNKDLGMPPRQEPQELPPAEF